MSSTDTSEVRLRPAGPVVGAMRVPGDKSISHRAAILGALARGTTVVRGFVNNLDCTATLDCVAALGARVERRGDTVTIESGGANALRSPSSALDARNSGTTIRLLAGALAGLEIETELTGDESLQRRPMERVAVPLRRMGATVETTDGRPPIRVRGISALEAITHDQEPPSAQVKSAIMLAGLSANGVTRVRERVRTRDHTERLLRAFGADAGTDPDGAWIAGPCRLRAADVDVPGDFSSAAFLVGLALLVPGSDVTIRGVSLNPTRTRLLDVLRDLGAEVDVSHDDPNAVEPTGTIRAVYTERLGPGADEPFEIGPATVAEIIDEVPILAALATRIEPGIRFSGAADLRNKESDRIAALAEGLGRLGARVHESRDSLTVGRGAELRGARVRSFGDHRIAMALACVALTARGDTTLEDPAAAAVSFPTFFDLLPAGSASWSSHD